MFLKFKKYNQQWSKKHFLLWGLGGVVVFSLMFLLNQKEALASCWWCSCPPTWPADYVVNRSTDWIEIKWNNNCGCCCNLGDTSGSRSYDLACKVSGEMMWRWTGISKDDGETTSASVDDVRCYGNVTPNITLEFQVETLQNPCGTSFTSEVKYSTTAIDAPSNLVCSDITSSSIKVSAQGAPNFTNLSAGSSGLFFREADGQNSNWIQATSYIFSGFSPSTSYSFYVQARNREGYLTTEFGPVNCSTSAVPPDLISQNLTYLPASPLPGNLMTLSGTIKNQGGSNAGVSQTRLRIDIGNNGDWDSDSWPTPPANQATGALTAGSSETETWNNVWTATAGTHKFEICADIGGAVEESAELNNCTVAFFTVSAAADFSLQAAPNNITAFPTDSKTSTITVVPSGGFNNNVQLDFVSVTPDNGCLDADTFSNNPVKPSDGYQSVLTINGTNCPVGNYTIQIKGKKGSDERFVNINYNVQVSATGNTYGYAWSENTGWIRFSCKDGGKPLTGNQCAVDGGTDYGVLTTDSPLYGYAWSENIGWISMNCDQSSVGGIKKCATEGGIDYSVTNTNGTLTGYAWSENIGWISFDDTVNNFYQVKINPTTGIFSGYAWSETVGYINFNSAGPPEYYVQTDWLGANNPPQVPYFPIPGHNTNGVSIYLDELKWKSGDPDFDVLEFDIYLDTDDTKIGKGVGPCPDGNCLLEVNNITLGGPVDINSDFTYLGLGLGDLLENKFYYWRVVALDTTGSATFAFSDANDATLLDFEPWRFKTGQKEPKIVTSTELNVPTQSLSFGNVTVGATKTMYVVVCNFGDKQLKTEKISLTSGANFSVGDKIYDDGGISHDRPNGTPPREYNLGVTTDGGVAGVCASSSIDQPSYNIVVKFNPLTTGNETDTLTIVSDDLNKPDYFINLDGTGDAPVESPGVDYTPSGGVKVRP